jgi:hypothetical protein
MAQMGRDAIISDNIVYEDALDKFQRISEEQIVSDGQVKKSRQAIIAGKLLSIRNEIKQLELQLKQRDATQQSAQDNKSELETLDALKKRLQLIYKSDGFKAIMARHEFAV